MAAKNDQAISAWVHNLRKLMAEQNFNPRSLSLRAGLNATAVRDMIEGRSKYPRYDTVQALARVLNTTAAQLMNENPTPLDAVLNGDFAGKDMELLTEIITRLQETTHELKRVLSPREFAAIAITIYRKLAEESAPPTRRGRLLSIKPQIRDLMDHESVRQKKSRP